MLPAWLVTLVLSLALFAGASAETSTHQASIRAGDCDSPGEPVTRWNLSPEAPLAGTSPSARPSMVQALGDSLVYGTTTVPMSLAQIGSEDHAIAVVAATGGAEGLLACGELSHFEAGSVDVPVGLRARDGSDLFGVAWLHDNENGTATVTIVLAVSADPAARPSGGGDQVDVTLSSFRYLPSPLEITVGTTVAWTNEDRLPHTTTASDGRFDSGYMAQGDTYRYTFDAPGTYPIFCVFHPRMRAVVIVE